ncbi:hypothetical protein [Clostridium ihumii]|uniref:hypothetical protein n=1 Tax=Clostridium ihumii TaxID=1470356 RepID=UPI000B08FC71|nr:hypothetical protein [Clostridium ihumii]
MVNNFLKQLRAVTTKEEFKEILKIAEQDIKFNRVGFNRLTNQDNFINICKMSERLIRN